MSKKILIVDDSLTARRLITKYLNDLNFKIIEASDGKHGLQQIEDNPDISLIFTDINMPQMGGLELVSQIKADAHLAQIPICLLTTETGSEALSRAKGLGVNAFLVKPIQKEQLLAVVNGYVL